MNINLLRLYKENQCLRAGIAERDSRMDAVKSKLRTAEERYNRAEEKLDYAHKTAASEANAYKLSIGELETKLKSMPSRAKAVVKQPIPQDAAATYSQLQQALEIQRKSIVNDLVAALDAGKPALRHQTLILWDMQNVPLWPSTSSTAADYIDKLLDVSRELSGAPDDSDYNIVAAFNPHSSKDGWGYVSPQVTCALNHRRGDLLAAGIKSGAADNILMRKLKKWLDDTARLGRARSVVFVTGDGDFTTYVADAIDAGCRIALLYRDSTSVSSSLLKVFPKETCRTWDAVVGTEGLAKLTRFQNELAARQNKAHEEAESAVNKRPDLLKTQMCVFIETGRPCHWMRTKGRCWFAHSPDELRPLPI